MSDWLKGLPGRVADNALGGLLAVAVLAGALLALVFLVDDLTLPAWVLALGVALLRGPRCSRPQLLVPSGRALSGR